MKCSVMRLSDVLHEVTIPIKIGDSASTLVPSTIAAMKNARTAIATSCNYAERRDDSTRSRDEFGLIYSTEY